MVHDPLEVESVCPCWGVPLTTGAEVLLGGDGFDAAVTTPVAPELADAEPPALVAVTTTTMVSPTSLAVNV